MPVSSTIRRASARSRACWRTYWRRGFSHRNSSHAAATIEYSRIARDTATEPRPSSRSGPSPTTLWSSSTDACTGGSSSPSSRLWPSISRNPSTSRPPSANGRWRRNVRGVSGSPSTSKSRRHTSSPTSSSSDADASSRSRPLTTCSTATSATITTAACQDRWRRRTSPPATISSATESGERRAGRDAPDRRREQRAEHVVALPQRRRDRRRDADQRDQRQAERQQARRDRPATVEASLAIAAAHHALDLAPRIALRHRVPLVDDVPAAPERELDLHPAALEVQAQRARSRGPSRRCAGAGARSRGRAAAAAGRAPARGWRGCPGRRARSCRRSGRPRGRGRRRTPRPG